MEPNEFSAALRRIATAIDKSKKPDRRLVAKTLREIIAKLDPERIDRIVDQGDRVDALLEVEDMKLEDKLKSAISDLQSALDAIQKKKSAA